jgi:hypothetical protein
MLLEVLQNFKPYFVDFFSNFEYNTELLSMELTPLMAGVFLGQCALERASQILADKASGV